MQSSLIITESNTTLYIHTLYMPCLCPLRPGYHNNYCSHWNKKGKIVVCLLKAGVYWKHFLYRIYAIHWYILVLGFLNMSLRARIMRIPQNDMSLMDIAVTKWNIFKIKYVSAMELAGCFDIKMWSWQRRNFHKEDRTVSWQSHHLKLQSLHW